MEVRFEPAQYPGCMSSFRRNCPGYILFKEENMGAILPIIVKITAIPAVSQLIQKVTGKLLGNQGVEAKVSAAFAPVALVQILKLALRAVGHEELALVVETQEANMLGAYVAVGAFVAYFTLPYGNTDFIGFAGNHILGADMFYDSELCTDQKLVVSPVDGINVDRTSLEKNRVGTFKSKHGVPPDSQINRILRQRHSDITA